MNDENSNKPLPTLRFKEFNSNGEWKIKRLGELVKIGSGFSPSQYTLSESGKYPFVKVEDLNNCEKYQTKAREYSDDSSNLIPKLSVIFPKRGYSILLNKVRLNVYDLLIDTNLMAITPSEEIESEFLYYVIVNEGLSKIADTSSIPQINNKHIIPHEVLVPLKKEQQKISACLSLLDELINAENQKLDALKAHKNGLMQQLFPMAENLPPLNRFSEFLGDFYYKELKSIVEKDRKIRYGIVQPGKFDPDGRLMVRGQDYSNGWVEPKTVFRVSDMIESRYQKARIKEGDLLITIVGAGTGLIEKVPKNFDGANITQTTARVAIDNSIAVPDYVRYYLQSDLGQRIIRGYIKGQAQPGLNVGDIELFQVMLTSFAEQEKIATCLSSLDELITAQAERIEALKVHKKGLMQQLFPRTE